MRSSDKGFTKNSYKITVRALESLIRLSEGMARLHCDKEIKPSYVKEVCRLLRQSNLTITKGDVEIENMIQDNIDRVEQMVRYPDLNFDRTWKKRTKISRP